MSCRQRSSRSNRWEEIDHQEKLILAKKREIEERLKSSEDCSKKEQPISIAISNDLPSKELTLNQPSSGASPPPNVPTESTSESSNTTKSQPDDSRNPQTFINKFSNDGSFLEMFKKMQQQNSSSSRSSTCVESKVNEKESRSTEKDADQNEPLKLQDIDERFKSSVQESDSVEERQTNKVSPSGDDEIRMAIEKSAIFVAMNGSEAEAHLKNDCVNDSDYRWLYQEDNVNHQYYKRRVAELREAKTRAADFDLSALPSTSTLNDYNHRDTSLALAHNDTDDRVLVDMKSKKRKESRWSEPSSSSTSNRDEEDEDYEESTTIPDSAPQDPELIKYAIQVYGRCDLTTDQWKQLEDQRKMRVLTEMLQRKRSRRRKIETSGKTVYEYDSDEEIDKDGTWEHKRRMKEMEKTQEWADQMTEMNKGKHHIGDFLPPDQLERFMKKWDSMKDGSTSLLFDEDYEDFKLQSQNKGFKMLEKLGWSEGQGLGADCSGTTKPVDADGTWGERSGLGSQRPDQLKPEDDEYEAYRKRMMLAYRFRPNPLNNPRRPYY